LENPVQEKWDSRKNEMEISPLKNRYVVIVKRTLQGSSKQSSIWLVRIPGIFRSFLRLSIIAILATVLLFFAKDNYASENIPFRFYYYKEEKDVIHYTNKPNSEKYSLVYSKQTADRPHGTAVKVSEGKENLTASSRNINFKKESILGLIPPGFPKKQSIIASSKRNALALFPEINQETNNSHKRATDNSAPKKKPGEKKISNAVPKQPSEKKITLACKKPDGFSLKKSRRPQNLIRPKNEIDQLVMEAANKYQLSPSLLKAIIKVESNFNPKAVSPKGARGLMQIMPYNFSSLNIRDPFDPRQNIMGGAKYLRQMFDYFESDLVKAIAAYNAGPGNVEKANGIPNIRETRLYVEKVIRYVEHYNKQ
jgi:soluble lytic murein transglycosylase-like protein